jgi:hypothetical protein
VSEPCSASAVRGGRKSPGGEATLERGQPILRFFETLQSKHDVTGFAWGRNAEAHERRQRLRGVEAEGGKPLEGMKAMREATYETG